MKNLKFIIIGAFAYIIMNTFLTGYGNVSSHREINQIIVSKFQDKFIRSAFPLNKFKKYVFNFQRGESFKGTFVNKGGLFITEDETRSLNPAQWIVHGGYSADEPEIFASFRHFYDPTEPLGNRYLHNHLDYLDEKNKIENPRIDHLEWALDHSEHIYSWENGKMAVIRALQRSDKDVRDSEMAFAWRALGETLHMIADMGLPAHVRDDSHAAEPYTGWQLGSPDPYEEYMEEISRKEGLLKLFNQGKLDLDLMDQMRKASTLPEIAILLAEYTNQNFFTTQTIYGSDVKPIIHSDDPYDSPTIDECNYDPVDYTFTKNIAGNEVIMCRDLKYRFGIFENRGYPYIDKKATYSQAKVLLPQIVEAGANTIKLFIPELKVEITEYDQKSKLLKGKVIHKTDAEYSKEIKYNGKVTIYNANKEKEELFTVECESGEFETKVKLFGFAGVNWKKYGIEAGIDFGGIYVISDPFKFDLEMDVNYVDFNAAIYGTIETTRGSNDAENKIITEHFHRVLTFRGKIISKANPLVVDLSESSYFGEKHIGYMKITMDDTNVEYVEIEDSVINMGGNYLETSMTYLKSKRYPFKKGTYHFYEADENDIVDNDIHGYSVSKEDFFDVVRYNYLRYSPDSRNKDYIKTTWIKTDPKTTHVIMDLSPKSKYDDIDSN